MGERNWLLPRLPCLLLVAGLALFGILSDAQLTFAQERSNAPEFSLSIPVGVQWFPGGSPGIGFGATGSVRLSRRFGAGVSLRVLTADQHITISDMRFRISRVHTVSALGEFVVFPFGTKRLFARVGLGVAYSDEISIRDFLGESQRTTTSIVFGAGSDIPLTGNLHLTPFFEAQYFSDSIFLEGSTRWILFAGTAVTIR